MTRRSDPAETEQPGERWIVDGLEATPRGPVARLERPDGQTVTLPLTGLPDGLQEGDVLALREGPDGARLVRLPAEIAARRAQAQARLDALNEAGRGALPLGDDGEMTL
ncbi:DUF3006 family protein [Deinococcus arcticus]|uniref:DUF3006 domain-containing protein n=1 Tax=Deinococcus arcticus TaxID=2136176 RepID=A0A2T3WA19_9DEIO|nr:DUF3006 family protein [Deinococcus arcticus]PTA68672.1 DUF3006 domain-containing protein [Deinococcus arcticus]